MKCHSCKSKDVTVRRENYLYTESALPNVTLLDTEVGYCAACGERWVTVPRIEDLHRALALFVIKKRARLTPVEIRFLRKYLGLSSVDLASRMAVDKATVSRWESEKSPQDMSPQAERLLRLMVAHEQPVEEYPLDTLEQVGTEAPKPMRIGMKADKDGWHAEAA